MVLTDLHTHTHTHGHYNVYTVHDCTLLAKPAYSREHSEGDQGDGQTEDGDGATHISNGREHNLMALTELCRTKQSNKDYAVQKLTFYKTTT